MSRSPRTIDARAGVIADNDRRRFIWLAYVALGVTLFAAYLISTFPYSTTLTKVLAPMGLEVTSTAQTASFPFGARLSGVRLISTRPTSATLVLESPAVTIAPSFLSMLMFHPGVRIKAALFDGRVDVTLHPSGGGTAIAYDLQSLDIARQSFFPLPDYDPTGKLSGDGTLWLNQGNLAQSGGGQLSTADLVVHSPFLGVPISLGDGQSKFKLDQGILTIEQCATHGGDLAINATGTVQLAPNPEQSELAIEFTLAPSPAAASKLSGLLLMLPHPPGPQPYRLTGTLSRPRLS